MIEPARGILEARMLAPPGRLEPQGSDLQPRITNANLERTLSHQNDTLSEPPEGSCGSVFFLFPLPSPFGRTR